MKDSEIEWIGEIPEDWEIVKIKTICNIYTGNSISNDLKEYYTDPENAIPYIATKDIEKDTNKINYNNGMYIKKNDNAFRVAKQYSVLLCIEGGSAGEKIAFTDQDVTFVNKLCCIKTKYQNTKFVYYYLMSPAFKSEFNLNMSGLIGGVSVGLLKQHYCTLPPLGDQEKVVKSLDKKVAQIDHIIEKTKESIEEYKKYKQSLITETVTKGLNPDVEMKDSGIEWIGEIPKHWNVVKIKHTSWIKGRIGWQGLRSSEFIETGPYLITGTDFNNGEINWDTCAHITDERYNEAPEIHVIENDLLVTKDGTIGKVAIAKNCPRKVSLNSGVFLVRNTKKIKCKNKYLYYVILSEVFWRWFNSNLTGNSTILHLYQEQFYNFLYVLPDIEEQQRIIVYLDYKCQQVDGIIKEKEQLIIELESYKKSLIYEYVTGKKQAV